MKVGSQNASGELACPSCGEMFGGDEPERAEFPEPTEVITGGGGAGRPTDEAVPDLDDLALEDELAPIPETPAPIRRATAETTIPKPRREEYRMPELISNVGERTWNPGVAARRKQPGFDTSKLASTSDERLAAAPDEEEGGVKAHVARKITGWDLDEDELMEGAAGASGFGKKGVATAMKAWLAIAGIVAVVVLFIGLIVYGVVQSLKEKEVVVREVEKPIAELAREAMSSVERDVMDRTEETFAAAGEVIESYLNAKTYQERLGFVRDASRIEPLMKRYYERNPDGPFPFRAPEGGWILRPYESFLLGTVISDDFSEHPIALEQRKEDGRYLVDWESFVGYCDIPWEEISERKSLVPFLLRARASVGDYYNHGFYPPDDSDPGAATAKVDGWACIKLQDRGQENTIYGYVKIGDPVLANLAKAMTLQGSVFITVKVAYPPDGKASNQFLITEVISKGWVFSDAVDPDRSGEDVEGEGGGGAGADEELEAGGEQ